jgi:hypothetical protein
MTKARDLADFLGDNTSLGTINDAYDAGTLSNRNLIINGKCSINQRGNNTGTNSVIGPDRFFIHSNNPSGHVIESSNQKDGPSGFDNCFQYKTTAAVTSSAADMYTGFAHRYEVQDIISYIWSGASHVTASFWVKSSIAGTFTFNINPEEATGGGSQDRILYESTYTISSTNTWEYKTITIPLSFLSSYALLSSHTDNGTGLELTWVMDIISGGNRTNITAGWNTPTSEARNMVTSTEGNTGFFTTVNSTFRITGIQLEVGDTATPFEHRSYGDELAKCQRYFIDPASATSLGTSATVFCRMNTGSTVSSTSSIYNLPVVLPTTMRASPSISVGSGTLGKFTSLNTNQNGRRACNLTVAQDITPTGFNIKAQDNVDTGHSGIRGWWIADAEL